MPAAADGDESAPMRGVAPSARGAAPATSGLARLFLPDAAVAFSLIAMLYSLYVYDGWTNLFRDSDSGWHIRNGEAILRSGALPWTDPYSWSVPGREWFGRIR